MKYIVLILSLSTLLACTSKKNNRVAKVENINSERVIHKKLNKKEIVVELEKLGYFNLTDESELNLVKTNFEQAYSDLNFFQGPMRGETLNFMDNRYYLIDCEELFEFGGLIEYLKLIKPTFKRLGLELNFSNEKSVENDNNWEHKISLNGTEYIAFDGESSDLDWEIAYVNFIEMLNAELKRQNSNERFYPVSCGNDGMFILLTPNQLDFVNRNYPMDSEHPTTLSNWKIKNGM